MKKKKIWSTITRLTFAFMFVASWAVLGVALALKTAKVEISGGITFTATDVYATISGSVTGSKSSNPIDEHPIEIDSKTSADFTIDESWTKMNLDFQDANTPIVVTIKIENKSSDRPFWIVFADNIEGYDSSYYFAFAGLGGGYVTEYGYNNTDVIRKINNETYHTQYTSPKYGSMKLDGGSSVTLETTLNIHNSNYSTDDDFKLGIELIGENAIKDESEYTKLTFNTDDTKKTASVKASSTDIEGEVVIPALFSKNGEIYRVTEIEGAEEIYHEGEWVTEDDGYKWQKPGTYEYIGGFANCTKMTSITIPATVTEIYANCLYNTSSSLIVNLECYIGWDGGGEMFDHKPTYTVATIVYFSTYDCSRSVIALN